MALPELDVLPPRAASVREERERKEPEREEREPRQQGFAEEASRGREARKPAAPQPTGELVAQRVAGRRVGKQLPEAPIQAGPAAPSRE